jgi:signal transduction histidine kinase
MHEFFNKFIHIPNERERQHVDPKEFKKILAKISILPLVLMTLISLLFIQQIRFVINENNKLRISDQMIALSSLSLKQIVDAETSFRGFMLTGKESFLHPLYESQKKLPEVIDRLKNLNRDNLGQIELLDHILGQNKVWMDSVEQNIQEKRKNIHFSDIEKFEKEKIVIDDIRLSVEQFQQTENAYRKERWDRADKKFRFSMFSIIIFAFIVGVLLSAVFLMQIKRISINYSRAYKSLAESSDKLEEAVENRKRELQTVNKELDAFSYSVSHDLKAPLRGIDGFSQIIVEEYSEKLDAEALRYLSFIRQGVQKMGVLIDDLIKLSRLTRNEFKKEEVDIAILTDELMKELTVPNPDRKVQFKNFDSEVIQADAGLLRVALQNLLNNAWKYSSNKDVTIIECGKTHKDGQVAYFIRDYGVGFDMRFYDKLFLPFQQLHPKEKYDGAGIGLATVARIIRRHGGNIWAESIVGEGTTFYFTLDVK